MGFGDVSDAEEGGEIGNSKWKIVNSKRGLVLRGLVGGAPSESAVG
jgi:hypothetical protein